MTVLEPIQPDHIILGCRELEEGIAYAEKISGYRAAFGGSHPGRGTCNALLKLGTRCYLEILAPDPEQKELAWHKELFTLEEPLLVGWAVPAANLKHVAAELRGKGVAYTGPTPGSRTKPNGEVLRWETITLEDHKAGILPFHIKWAEDSPHPSSDAPGGCLYRTSHRTGHVVQTGPPGSDFHLVSQSDSPAQLTFVIAGRYGEFELKTKAIPSESWSK
jgi:Glyoxalase-like domain